MPQSPAQIVKERFKDKGGLIKAVQALAKDDLWIDRLNAEKGLERVSSRKLLHLHGVLETVKNDFGSRKKLIEAIAASAKRDKDADYRAGLESYPTPRLLDLYKAGQKRARAAS